MIALYRNQLMPCFGGCAYLQINHSRDGDDPGGSAYGAWLRAQVRRSLPCLQTFPADTAERKLKQSRQDQHLSGNLWHDLAGRLHACGQAGRVYERQL